MERAHSGLAPAMEAIFGPFLDAQLQFQIPLVHASGGRVFLGDRGSQYYPGIRGKFQEPRPQSWMSTRAACGLKSGPTASCMA